MSPAETATILRQFNEWRRGDEDIPQFDPREIGEAIDAAIERLELAEKERDALRARIEVMEKQEPVAWMHPSGPHPMNAFCEWRTPKTEGAMG